MLYHIVISMCVVAQTSESERILHRARIGTHSVMLIRGGRYDNFRLWIIKMWNCEYCETKHNCQLHWKCSDMGPCFMKQTLHMKKQ